MRLTTRRIDAFTEAEEKMLLYVAHHRSVWFDPGTLERENRDALTTLQRLGHIVYDARGRPPDRPAGGCGYLIVEHGMAAVAELWRREKAA